MKIKTAQLPELPTPKYIETIRGVPCITLTEHEHLMRAYALQAITQVQGEAFGYIHHFAEHDERGALIDTTWEADGCADPLPHPTSPSMWKWTHCTPFYTTQQPAQATQTETQQPATGEPVLFIHPDTFAMNNSHVGAWKPGHELPGYIPLYPHPAPGVPGALKDHQISALVNKVRDIARMFHGHQSLRERIAIELVPALKVSQEVKSNSERVPMTDRELELIDGMITVQLGHAQRCDAISNRDMAEKQKGWDLERVELLRRIRSLGITAQEGTNGEIN